MNEFQIERMDSAPPLIDLPRSNVTPDTLSIHSAVKVYFRNISLSDLWEVGKEELLKRQDLRLTGKRAALRVEQARIKMRKKGRPTYYPTGWLVMR